MYLEVKNLKKSYGEGGSFVRVLKGISVSVSQGDMCVIEGASGSGKSTLLNCIGGLDQVDSGSIRVDGKEISGLSQDELSDYRREKLGFIFQFYNLVPNFTVRENVQVCEYLTDSPLDLEELLDTLGLAEHQNKFPCDQYGRGGRNDYNRDGGCSKGRQGGGRAVQPVCAIDRGGRSELLRHYLTLPVLITLMAGIIGTALGYSDLGTRAQMGECYNYFSIPALDTIYEPYLLLYGIVMPPVAAALTNFVVIRKKLGRPVLSLIRNEQKMGTTHNITIHSRNFVRIFQIRQLLREKRSAFTMFFGMFISLLVVMLSLNCFVLCEHIKTENREDTKFEYMYTYKYPEEQVPDGGEAAYGVTLKKEVLGYNMDVTLLGIGRDNPYFDIVKEEKESFRGKDKVQISSAMAQKYQLKTGDDLVLKDEENDRNYAFTIEGIVPYSTSFFAFMDIDSMRELMGEDEKYYNIVFADRALDPDSSRLYAVTSKEEIEKNSAVFVD